MKKSSNTIQIREHARRLKQMAHSDDLTGLSNRVVLEERLQKAIDQSKRWGQLLAVVRLRLEGFEAIRDRHGRQIGDQVLVALAHAMKRTLAKSDTLACFEGDKFAAILPALEDKQASFLALNRLLEAAAEPIRTGDGTFQLSASIGVAFYPQEGDADANQLLRQASVAMHRARAAGKNRYHFFDSKNDPSQKGHPETPERIRQALETLSLIHI